MNIESGIEEQGTWADDPFKRFVLRWWDGSEWTQHVADASGITRIDPTPVAKQAQPGPTAKAVGTGVRNVLREVGQVPGISLTADVLREKHSIPLLTDLVKKHPADPVARLWLGEAYERMERDRRIVRIATFSPAGVVMRKGMEVAARVGSDGSKAKTSTRCFAGAHLVARKRMAAKPRDLRALDALARLYLKASDPRRAVHLARLATLAAPEDGVAFVTLSRAYLAAGRRSDAWYAAHAALRRGFTVGNEILPLLGGPPAPIDQRDRLIYYGPRRNSSLVGAVAQAQKQKASTLAVRAKPMIEKARPVAASAGQALRSATSNLTTPASERPIVIAAGWYPDPTDRHELRSWDGQGWTDWVADDGIVVSDPIHKEA